MKGFDPSIIEESERNNVSYKINNELKDFFRFIELLRLERPEKNKYLIDSFIKKESNVLKRITYIEELDREESFLKNSVSDSSEDIKTKTKTKTKIKRKKWTPIIRESFIRFLFSNKKKLKSFANQTNVINAKLFSMSFYITNDSKKTYKWIIEKVIYLLLGPTVYILENKWDSLGRLEYNVINTFSKFIKGFLDSGNILKINDVNTICSIMNSFISPYLQIVSNENYKTILINTFRDLFPYTKQLNNLDEVMNFLSQLIDITSNKITLYNVITGVYMLSFRRHVELADLVLHNKVKEIDNSEYNFSKKVVQKIKDHLESLKSNFKKAEKELFYMQFVENNFNLNYKDEDYLTNLIALVYHHSIIKDFKSFESLKLANNVYGINFIRESADNMTLIFIRLIKGFILFYEDLLKGTLYLKKVHIELEEAHTLFLKQLFIEELNRLLDISNELERLKQRWSITIPFDVYKEYINTNKTEVEKEKIMCDIYKMTLDTLYLISQKLGQILYNNYLAQQLAVKDKSIFDSYSETINYIDDKPRLLPFSTYIISNHQYLNDKVVINAFGNVMIFCVNICQLFQYPELEKCFSKKRTYINITEEYFNIKSKLN